MPRIRSYKYEYLATQAYEAWRKTDPSVIAVDTETEGVGWYDPAFAATLAWDAGSFYIELADPAAKEVLNFLLARVPTLVFHNAKFDLQKLILAGVLQRDQLHKRAIEDTECAYHLLDAHGVKKLKHLAKTILGENTEETEAIRAARKKLKIKVDEGLHLLPRAVVVPYAVKDAEFTWRLWKILRPQIRGRLVDLYEDEMELTLALLDMEAAGMRVDLDYLHKTTKEYAGAILKAELEIGDLVGARVWHPEKSGQKTPDGCINLDSWQQVLPVLKARGVPTDSTSNDELRPHADSDRFVALLLELRKLKKIYSTYLLGIERERRGEIIHPNFRQHGAKTGRMSSGGAEDG